MSKSNATTPCDAVAESSMKGVLMYVPSPCAIPLFNFFKPREG